MKRLEDGDFEWLVSYRKEHPGDTETVYGVFVPALDLNISDCSPEIMDIPEDLLMLLQYADKVGCDWIMLDADEEEIPELQIYRDEWKAAEVWSCQYTEQAICPGKHFAAGSPYSWI